MWILFAKEKLHIFAHTPPPAQPSPSPVAHLSVPEWSSASIRLRSRHGVSSRPKQRGPVVGVNRHVPVETTQPDLHMCTLDSSVIHEEGQGRRDAAQCDCSRWHIGSRNPEVSACENNTTIDVTEEKELNVTHCEEGSHNQKREDHGHQDAILQHSDGRRSHLTKNDDVGREAPINCYERECYDKNSRLPRSQRLHLSSTAGGAAHHRPGFDLTNQPNIEKITSFLQRANLEFSTLRPGDPISDSDSCSNACSPEESSHDETCSSGASARGESSTSSGSTSRCENTPECKAQSNVADNVDADCRRMQNCSQSAVYDKCEASSPERSDAIINDVCSVRDQDRPSDVATCRLPELDPASDDMMTTCDVTSGGEVGRPSPGEPRRPGGEDGTPADRRSYTLPSIDGRNSLAEPVIEGPCVRRVARLIDDSRSLQVIETVSSIHVVSLHITY